MNFLLVGFTFVVLAFTVVGIAVLGTDRLVPARKVLEFVSRNGIDVASGGETPLILSQHPDAEELTRIRFATAVGGYNRDEVDGVLTQLIAENKRLRNQLHGTAPVSPAEQPASTPVGDS